MNNSAVALCAVGAEKAVSNELRKLSLKVDEASYGKVRFKTDLNGIYKSLIGLRAADRVLLEIAKFKADNFDSLFEGTLAAQWETLIPKGMGLIVTKVRTNRSQLKAETSIQAVVHKAAAQRLCGKYKVARLPELPAGTKVLRPTAKHAEKKQYPSFSNEASTPAGAAASACAAAEKIKAAELRVYIEKDTVSLLLDLCGEPLFKRGYRSEGGTAPLRETTAAALLLLAGWKRKLPLYDPFCGSGTFLIEALSYAWDMAPGLGRSFAIEDLLIADSKIEKEIREEFYSKIDFSRLARIAGSDEDVRSVSITASNAARLYDIACRKAPERGIRSMPAYKGTPLIELKNLHISKARPLAYGSADEQPVVTNEGLLITNPPYGKRLGDAVKAEQTYRDMSVLRENFLGWKIAVITDHAGFESFFGKKADSCREISNGNIPAYFYQYD